MPTIQLHDQPPLPKRPRPIYIIGAGSIVKDAHLPAYQIAGFEVQGITNRSRNKAEELAETFNIKSVFDSVEQMVEMAPSDAVYDLTLPANYFAETLRKLPDGAAVLIQKPMGENRDEAEEILRVCREKNLTAAINFQLRFAPVISMARDAIAQGLIGELTDFEVRVNVDTPWHLWDFLDHAQFAEIYYHSIHYVDMIRSFLGNAQSVQCQSMGSHTAPNMDKTRSSYILDYGPDIRVNIQTNHQHRFGKKHQESYVKWEGTQGAIKAQLGVLMDYPKGEADWFEICVLEDGKDPEWQKLPVSGSWFPHAFIGAMGSLMHKLENPSAELPHSVEDVIHSMRTVDAAVRSSQAGGMTFKELTTH
ncbi:Gfo/Idh/MocA family protein [Rubritalea marina]|uniref:Gfo/Idh/MocA family protein n=1 Tax=Rubritalea marina TaxID=361055 RepID=UPI00037BF5E6|nr:Gfo/Idh/MocA family oxidoreductase [Rubritalea marina]